MHAYDHRPSVKKISSESNRKIVFFRLRLRRAILKFEKSSQSLPRRHFSILSLSGQYVIG